MRYPVITGPGIELSSPDALGRKARAINMPPMQYPTLREATPVICANDAVPGLMMLGTAPMIPAIRLVAPVPDNAPCTCRKSTARLSRHETRCIAMSAPFAWMEMMTPRKRNDGRSVQNWDAEVERQPRPLTRKAHPGRLPDAAHVIDS